MATFVLVPGGWHGSWSFEAVVRCWSEPVMPFTP